MLAAENHTINIFQSDKYLGVLWGIACVRNEGYPSIGLRAYPLTILSTAIHEQKVLLVA